MWGFAVLSERAVEAAPKHDEFFLASVADQAHALVRELTQNSADAVLEGNSQVQLRFRFIEVERQLFHSRYLRTVPNAPALAEHLSSAGMQMPLAIDDDGPVKVLVIEDFGTTGLNGAYDKYEEKSSFQAFWKRYGTSNKGDDRGGRHGIGKSVVPSSSRTHAFFGLTKRSEDGRELFMGQIVLRPHRLSNRTYDSFGQFSPTTGDTWAMPYDDPRTISNAKSDFGLERLDEPGLSLVVPYVRPEINEDGLLRAAVEHCFHQVLTGHLRITVGQKVLEKDTILRIVDEMGDADLKAAAQLSAEAAAGVLPTFEPIIPVVKHRLAATCFDDPTIQAMRSRFESDQTVCVKVPIEIQVKSTREKRIGSITLYLKRAADAIAARETYVRGRVTVPNQQRQLGGSALIGLLVAEDGAASEFLGDSEDVAHTKWVKNKLSEKYVNPAAAFDVVKGALRELKRILVGEGEDHHVKDALKDLFWQPKIDGGAEKDKKKPDSPPDPPPEPNPPVLVVREIEGGFNAEVQDFGGDVSVDALLEVTYAVRRGSARWSKEDFQFGTDIKVVATGQGQVEWEANRIRIAAARKGFRVKAVGFDANRDVVVRVRADRPAEVGS